MPGEAIAFGAVTRAGIAVIVAVRAGASGPSFAGRWEITLVPEGVPDQPYHADDPGTAARLVSEVEQAAGRAAGAGLTQAAMSRSAGLPAGRGMSCPGRNSRSAGRT